MKRFIALTLVVAMLLSLFGCIADEKIFSKAKPLNEKLEDINMQNVILMSKMLLILKLNILNLLMQINS